MTPTTRASGDGGGSDQALGPAPRLDPLLEAGVPRRLLLVGGIGGDAGDSGAAAAAAVGEQVAALWPHCELRHWQPSGTLVLGTGAAARWAVRTSIGRALADLAYRELSRRPGLAGGSRRIGAAIAGRLLAPVVDEFRPDLAVSTHPLGTAALDWLRRRARLVVPSAALVPDPAPHPLSVYPEVDVHLVPSTPSLRAMERDRPDVRVALGAPPVRAASGPADRSAARAALGLPRDRRIVLVALRPGRARGVLGGRVDRVVDAALTADPSASLVVACGADTALHSRLAAREEPRLVPMGGVEPTAELITAADLVVTDALGATATRTLAAGRAVVALAPGNGQARASAEVLAEAGLGWACPDVGALADVLRATARAPSLLAAAEGRAAEHARSSDFADQVASLPDLARHRGSRPLVASDALYIGAATGDVPQQVGAVALLEPVARTDAEPGGPDVAGLAAGLRRRFAERAEQLPMLRKRLWTTPRRPRWLVEDAVDPAEHIRARALSEGHGPCWDEAVRQFLDTPLPTDRPPWELQVLGAPGRTAVLAKLHHCLGDSAAVTETLSELLSDAPEPNLHAVSPDDRPRPEPRPGGGRVLRGLFGLATAGRAAVGTPRRSGAHRRYATAELPSDQVRQVVRELHTEANAVLLGVLGEALYRHGAPVRTSNGRLRTAVPLGRRRVESAGVGGLSGVGTAAVMLDLPVAEMSVRERIAAVADELLRLERQGQSVAARFGVWAIGLLPAGPHARLSRLVYGGRFFGLIASVMPGRRRELRMFGRRLTSAYPLLPLAEGVGLAVGFLGWGEVVGVGVTADRALFPDADGFAATLLEVFTELTTRP